MAQKQIVSEAEEIWNGADWATRRALETSYYDWYSGKKLKNAVSRTDVDADTGQATKLYPLELNPISKMCRAHRDVTVGMIDDYSEMPIQVVFRTSDEAQKPEAVKAQNFVNDVFYYSDGATTFPEGILLANVHGGHYFRAIWDPTNDLLPSRIKIESIKSPFVYPVYDAGDFWNLREVWIGYEIDGATAQEKYGIGEDGIDSLYMEHWTRTGYTVYVDGVVPAVDGIRLEGDHGYKRVPGVYIPHFRDGEFFGPSLVDALIGLTIEKNARAADKGDSVYEVTHPTLVAKNIRASVTKMVVETDDAGNVIKTAANIGAAQNIPNAHEPSLDYATIPNPPDSVMGFDSDLTTYILQQADVAPVLLGVDDTASGRITGPVSNMRALSTVQHCQAERQQWSIAVRHLADIILRMAEAHAEDYRTMNIDVPAFTEKHRQFKVKASWAPMVPLEETERVETLNSRLRDGGISLEEYLIAFHDNDPKAHAEAIWADKERQAKIESAVEMEKMKMQMELEREKADQQMAMQQEKNDQQLTFSEEKNKQQLEISKKKAAQQPKQGATPWQ